MSITECPWRQEHCPSVFCCLLSASDSVLRMNEWGHRPWEKALRTGECRIIVPSHMLTYQMIGLSSLAGSCHLCWCLSEERLGGQTASYFLREEAGRVPLFEFLLVDSPVTFVILRFHDLNVKFSLTVNLLLLNQMSISVYLNLWDDDLYWWLC